MTNIIFTPESRAQGIERLLTLYTLIPGIPHHGFNMNVWRFINKEDDEFNVSDKTLMRGIQPTPAGQVRTHCGTSACAMGWAAAYPPFKKVGLGYSIRATEVSLKRPGKETLYYWDAISAFFSLPVPYVKYIFSEGQAYPDCDEMTTKGKKHLKSFKPTLGRGDGATFHIKDQRVGVMYRILIFLAMEGHLSLERTADAWMKVTKQIEDLAPMKKAPSMVESDAMADIY